MRKLPIPATVSRYWPFRGGLDQVSPTISMSPSVCRSASNVEVGPTGGLVTLKGYERFDGRPKPSDATYSIIEATITGSYSLGNTLTGATSAATGVIIAATSTYFVVTKVSGTFQSGETLNISGNPVATATSAAQQGAGSTPAVNATYNNLAADKYRADIAVVPGSGSILGVWKYNGVEYAVRNNAGGTAAVLHKSSSSGWTAVALGRELAFTSGGTYEVVAGNTITGATSGATAVVTKVILTSGTWAGGDAAGRFIFASQTGTFQAENLNVGATLNVGTIAGNSTANTLAPSGRYEFINYNFGGLAGATRMYGCSGTHKAFEFDGTVFAFVHTGMTTDTPSHIFAHKNHLFLSFAGSVQHSGIGSPHIWSVVTGAAELAVGDTVTGFMGQPGAADTEALTIFTRNSVLVLYGKSSADWNLTTFNPDAGAYEWTPQYIYQGVYLDDRGITPMSASQSYGNFSSADVSAAIRPYLEDLKSSAIASCIVREKNQYRLYFSGGAALHVTFIGSKVAGLMPVSMAHPVTCICSLEASSGREEIFFGSTDGYVYQAERGTSQDGEPISWHAELAYNHFGSPRQIKTWRKAVVEVSGGGYAGFYISSSIGYGSVDIPQGDSASVSAPLTTSQWDSFTWDAFFWDGQSLIPAECDLDGSAENLSLIFSGSSDEFEPITLNGAIVDYTNRRALR